MPGVEVLALHGPPGSGKTTLSRAIAEVRRLADQPNAVIDLDVLILGVYSPLSIAAMPPVSLVGLSWAMDPSDR